MTIPVTVLVLTRNEAPNIAACLESLADFAQVLVVDSHSGDATADIAAGLGVPVVPFTWDGGYPKKKQWSLEQAGALHDWVLFVDADERVTPALAAEIRTLFRQGPPAHAAYFIDSRPVVLGRVLRFGQRYRKIALLDRRRAGYPVCADLHVAAMWEVEGHYQPLVAGSVGRLSCILLHVDLKPPFAWFERHNRYSDWEAALDLHRDDDTRTRGENKKRRLAKHLFRCLPGRPLWVFLYDYVICLGLLDGEAGLHHALSRAFYYWQIGYKRAWLRLGSGQAGMACGSQSSASASSAPASPASALISSNARRRTLSSGMR